MARVPVTMMTNIYFVKAMFLCHLVQSGCCVCLYIEMVSLLTIASLPAKMQICFSSCLSDYQCTNMTFGQVVIHNKATAH